MKCLDFTVKNLQISFPGKLVNLLLIFFFHGLSGNILAVEVADLYQGTIVVESRDNEKERLNALPSALRQVLIKVTGNPAILSQSIIRQALSNAEDYVDTYSYRNVSGTIDSDLDPVSSIELSVTFSKAEILNLLDSANISLWPGNRPYTLVWLVAQGERGVRQIVGSSSNEFNEVINLLEMEAGNRALPLLLPILDFEDLRAVSTIDVWEMNAEKLLQASSRYQSESVLVTRLYITLGGDVVGKSSYLFRGQVFELEMFEEPVENFLRESVALATNEISAYYSVLLSGTDSNVEVNLTVEGIANAEDYAALLKYVTRLTDVNNYQIAGVENQTIMLRLSTGGQIRQLIEAIALNRTMVPLGELVRNDNQVYMSYQWNN